MEPSETYWSPCGDPVWKWYLIAPCEPVMPKGLTWTVLATVHQDSNGWIYAPCIKPWSMRNDRGPFSTAEEAMACYGQKVELRVPAPEPKPDPFADLPLFAQATA